MDFKLSEEQEMIRQTARDFAQEHLAPHAAERDEKQFFPKDVIKQMGEL
ncbi:MAG TPA: acyl-CoA dehydrogenase family protein, partial [bacterium]|nr:acyl-CoA dehydrogenase family protein [bacterium]